MIFRQQSYLPIIFQVDEGIILKIDEYLKRNNMNFQHVLVVSGASYSHSIAQSVVKQNNWEHYVIQYNSFDEVKTLKSYILQHDIDLLVSVGGGKVIDTTKRASYFTQLNHLVVPTTISNDGLISPISVLVNPKGITESLPSLMPMGVVIDIDIIQSSPVHFIRSAAGDILSNISASNDWILAFQHEKEKMNDIAFHLAKSAANALIHYDNIALTDKPFLRLVVQGQINSGIAMGLAGTSRPCSGSEHLISHAIDYLNLSKNILHGTQVASISLFTLFLQDKLEIKHMEYAKKIGVPLDFGSFIQDLTDELFIEIIEKAKEMRPGRFTVLDCSSIPTILERYKEFKAYIHAY